MEIRRAEYRDIKRINELLYQVAKIHADGRPDIFRENCKKYSDEELFDIIRCEDTPVFVASEGDCVLGYAFCIDRKIKNDALLQDKRTLYVDDICVDERARGRRIGTKLYEYVTEFARENGYDNITLNVWAFNEKAYRFYEKCGMTQQKIIMEKSLQE